MGDVCDVDTQLEVAFAVFGQGEGIIEVSCSIRIDCEALFFREVHSVF